MSKYNIYFTGKPHEHVTVDELKHNLAKLFKSDLTKIEKLFADKDILIKKNLPEEQLEKYQKTLFRAGAKIRVVEIKEQVNSALQGLTNYNQASASTETNQLMDNSFELLPAGTGSLEEFITEVEFTIPDLSEYSLTEAQKGSLEEFKEKVTPIELADTSYMDITDMNDRYLSDQSEKVKPVEIKETTVLSVLEANSGSLEEFIAQPEDYDLSKIEGLTLQDDQNKEKK